MRRCALEVTRKRNASWPVAIYIGSKTKKPRNSAAFHLLDFLEETGAGEAIRTLDPNLGKVVLYP
jgi:hypothetical protein